MKKIIIITILFLATALSSSATEKGFKVKVYENNVHFMSIAVDYVNKKVKIQTSEFTQDYCILHNIAEVDKSKLYLGVIQVQLYNNGDYDKSKEETLIFNLIKSTFSTSISKTEYKCDFYLID